MIEQFSISQKNDPLFEKVWKLYQSAFPLLERRSLEYQVETMQRSEYSLDVITEGGNFIGFLCWWRLNNVRYIEHLATLPTLRGKGYGKIILEHFIRNCSTPIILEAEHPTEQINLRRIGFYQRSGFHLNDFEYTQPSYSPTQNDGVKLLLMSYPKPLTQEDFESFERACHTKVHFGNKQRVTSK